MKWIMNMKNMRLDGATILVVIDTPLGPLGEKNT
jgi:hypothetical protein